MKFFEGKKVLITGHTGFKGSWLSKILINMGANVAGIAMPPLEQRCLFNIFELEKMMSSHFCDIRNYDAVKDIIIKEQPEIIFHLAAQPLVRASYDDPMYTFTTNILGTTNLLNIVRELGFIRSCVIITTDKVYRENIDNKYLKEDDPLGGYDPYSASKASSDIIAQSFMQSFFNPKFFGETHNTLIAIARAGNVIGGGDWNRDRLIPDFIKAEFESNSPVTLRNPDHVRPWQHVFEPLYGYILLANKLLNGEKKYCSAWNFGPNYKQSQSVQNIIEICTNLLEKGNDAVIEETNSQKHETVHLILDSTKAITELGWKTKLNLIDSLKLTIDWYKGYYTNPLEIKKLSDNQIKSFFN